MSGIGTFTTTSVIRAAAAAHGFDETDAGAPATFDDLLFTFACGTIDAALLVAHGRKTIQPEDFASLAKLHAMFSTPLTPGSRSSRRKAMTGGTTNTGSYYSPGNEIDQTAYMYEGDPTVGHGGSTTLPYSDDSARSGLYYHSMTGGGGTSTSTSKVKSKSKVKSRSRNGSGSGSRSDAWTLPSESVTRLLREYRLRFNTDLRVTDAAKLYMRATLQSNMDAILGEAARRASSKSRNTRLTAAALKRAADGHVLVLV